MAKQKVKEPKGKARESANKKVASAGKRKATSQESKAAQTPPKKPTKKQKKTKPLPVGRTLTTHDNFLPENKNHSTKTRPVVVIETNDKNELAVVPLSKSPGKNKTPLKGYQKGESYFRHYVEIEDDEGNPIVVNDKFRANHKNMDVPPNLIEKIKDKIFHHSMTSSRNRKKIDRFRKK